MTVNVFLPHAGACYGYAETRLSMIVVDPLQIPSPIDQDHGTTAVSSAHYGAGNRPAMMPLLLRGLAGSVWRNCRPGSLCALHRAG
jgi:hypothetical protein